MSSIVLTYSDPIPCCKYCEKTATRFVFHEGVFNIKIASVCEEHYNMKFVSTGKVK